MPKILKLTNSYIKKSVDEYLGEIRGKNTNFVINEVYLLNLINGSLNEYHVKSILFVCLAIAEDKTLDAFFQDRDIPKSGTEFINKRLNIGLGVYHIHLTEGYVLIWYITWSSGGKILKFRYIQHPAANDNYQIILNEIYEKEFGYNPDRDCYFVDTKHLLLENILYFADFIRVFS